MMKFTSLDPWGSSQTCWWVRCFGSMWCFSCWLEEGQSHWNRVFFCRPTVMYFSWTLRWLTAVSGTWYNVLCPFSQRCYEHKQYRNGLKFCKQILSNPKFSEHGGKNLMHHAHCQPAVVLGVTWYLMILTQCDVDHCVHLFCPWLHLKTQSPSYTVEQAPKSQCEFIQAETLVLNSCKQLPLYVIDVVLYIVGKIGLAWLYAGFSFVWLISKLLHSVF